MEWVLFWIESYTTRDCPRKGRNHSKENPEVFWGVQDRLWEFFLCSKGSGPIEQTNEVYHEKSSTIWCWLHDRIKNQRIFLRILCRCNKGWWFSCCYWVWILRWMLRSTIEENNKYEAILNCKLADETYKGWLDLTRILSRTGV